MADLVLIGPTTWVDPDDVSMVKTDLNNYVVDSKQRYFFTVRLYLKNRVDPISWSWSGDKPYFVEEQQEIMNDWLQEVFAVRVSSKPHVDKV